MTDTDPRWCVLIPCFNEARAISDVLAPLVARQAPVIVVDDGSDDGTPSLVEPLPVTLVQRQQRGGKGAALRTGFRTAIEAGYDTVITMDGDGQHDPADVWRLLAAANRYPDSLVIGARLRERERQPGYRRMANGFADWGVSWACGVPVVDTQSGQRLYPRAALTLGASASGGFVFEADLLIAATRRGVGVVAVPIETRYGPHLRSSYFRPLRDFTRITRRVIGHVIRHGDIGAQYRRGHRGSPLVFDPPRD